MKTTMKMMPLMMSLMTLTACDYSQKKEFRAERAAKTYQSAMADYQAGRLDAAIKGFEKVLKVDPSNASARFQLACLLQDHKNDYLGALCGYKEYGFLTPQGEKAQIAKERAARCEQLLTLEIAKKQSLTDATAAQQEVVDLQAKVAAAEQRVAELEKSVESLSKAKDVLTQENTRLRRMLPSVEEDETATRSASALGAVKALLEEEDAETTDRLKLSPDAKSLFEEMEDEDEQNPQPREQDENASQPDELGQTLRTTTDKWLKRETVQKDDGEPPHEPRPEFYTVQEGDTLYRLALRFYGRRDAWKKIMEANKATISSDARIRTGQTIKLP